MRRTRLLGTQREEHGPYTDDPIKAKCYGDWVIWRQLAAEHPEWYGESGGDDDGTETEV